MTAPAGVTFRVLLAARVLTDTAEGKDFLLHARIATLRALNRHRVVARRQRRDVGNPDRGPRRLTLVAYQAPPRGPARLIISYEKGIR
jgi:hypothetical protein